MDLTQNPKKQEFWLGMFHGPKYKIKGNNQLNKLPEVRALLLAAGLGSRLRPLTEKWPKCLMPIGDRPLLEYWLETLNYLKVSKVLVNLCHHHEIVREFLNRTRFENWVESAFEEKLLGTAGTIRANHQFFQDCTTLLVHADNWCQCNFSDFLKYHFENRPDHCPITMMTFKTLTPETCGIVETDKEGVVFGIHEKIKNPPGCLANGAVYLLEPEVLKWIGKHSEIGDFSTELLPNYLGRIATWNNTGIHRDIGELPMLLKAQFDPTPNSCWPQRDSWQKDFLNQPIHSKIAQTVT